MTTIASPVVTIPRLWPESLVVCLGSGPSLTVEDVAAVRGRARVIAINSSYTIAPWADVLYACDAKWWGWEKGAPSFTGRKYALEPQPAAWPGVEVLKNTGPLGLETDPSGLRTGKHSGYQSLGLAFHLGASRILLLGFDLKVGANGKTHFFGDHPDRQPSPYAAMLDAFPSIVQPLKDAGVEVVNCTPDSALRCFPCASLQDVLSVEAVCR